MNDFATECTLQSQPFHTIHILSTKPLQRMNFDIIKAQIWTLATLYGGKVLLALLAFIIGRFIVGKISSMLSNVMEQNAR
jgi:hypothetical protein